MEHNWNNADREEQKYVSKKTVILLVCSPQIPHRQAWQRTRASAARGQQADIGV
jgi:hypothetical protein